MAPIQIRGTGIAEHDFEADKNKCHRYALFMENVGDAATNGTIWACFLFIIILLIISSHFFSQSEEKRQAFLQNESDDVAENTRLERAYQTRAWRCTWVTIAILPLMFMSLFAFAIAALNLQFCHGEDLMMFYWASWTLIGCGSFIAEVGLVIAQLQNCLHPHHPTAPWAVALGTPVPVICGAAHYLRNLTRYRSRDSQAGDDQETEKSNKTVSQVSFAQRGRPVSTTTEIELIQLMKNVPPGAECMGKLQDDDVYLVKIPAEAVQALSSNATSPDRESTVESPLPAARESSR